MPGQIVVSPLMKFTLPVGVPTFPVTPAQKVTATPALEGFSEEARRLVVLDAFAVKAAATLVGPAMVTVHGPVPLHPAPLQPVKVELVAELAVSVTAAPTR